MIRGNDLSKLRNQGKILLVLRVERTVDASTVAPICSKKIRIDTAATAKIATLKGSIVRKLALNLFCRCQLKKERKNRPSALTDMSLACGKISEALL